MKKLLSLVLLCGLWTMDYGLLSAQNVGVDVASPVEKLDVLGAIHIGTTTNTNAGTIRWNSPNFQGYDGTQWINFGGGTLTGSGTATHVAFWDGTNSLSSNANLYWDNTNSRLGIGTSTPSYNLQVYHTSSSQGAAFFRINNSSNNGSALYASTNGGGSSSAIYAYNNGWGRAGNFEINNSSSDRSAIYASTNGVGHTIHVDQAGSGGRALYLQTGNSTNTSPTLYSNTFGTGRAGEFRIDNSGSSASALYASTSGTGPAIEAAGKLKTTTFQMTTSPTANYVLRSDASGNATWVDPNTLVTGLLPTGTSAQTLRHDGTNWVANSIMVNNGTNVGIGTTSPDYKLHVSGSDYLTLKLVAPANPLLKLSGSYNSGNGAEFWQDNTGDARLNINGTLNAIYMKSTGDVGIGMVFPSTPAARLDINNGTSTVPIFVARDNGTEVVRIADGGSVGIGTSNPTNKLDVVGGSISSSDNYYIGNTSGTGTTPFRIDGVSNRLYILAENGADGSVSGTEIRFRTASTNAAASDRMTIINDGNVGIGTTAPGAKLEVAGQVKITGGTPALNQVLTSDANGLATWEPVPVGTVLQDADADTKVQVEESPDEDIIRFDAAGTQLYSMRKIAGGSPWLEVNSTNTLIGSTISTAINGSGTYNTAVGYQAAQNLTTGQKNTYYGDNAGGFNTTGHWNTMIGTVAGQFNNGGNSNTMIGANAGRNNLTGSGNVFLGNGAGENETGSDKLYIDNGNTATPLIYGNFSTNTVQINSNLNINGAYTMPTVAGTNGYVLKTNGAGATSWADPNTLVTGLLPSGTTGQTVRHNGTTWVANSQLYNDGTNVGIGTTAPGAYLDITGTNAGTTSLQLRSGNTQNSNTSTQIIFSYDGLERQRHNIKSRHNSGGTSGNAIDFYVWKYLTDADGAIGTEHVMTIDGGNGGSVGIGTTSPSSALDVRRSSDTDGDAISFGTPTYFMGRLGETVTTNKVYIANTYNSDASYIDFRLKGTAEANSKMVIKGNGYVGIGTTNPISKLHINGPTLTVNGYNTNPIELISGGSLPVFKWYGSGNLYFSHDPNVANIGNEAVGVTQVMVLTPSGNLGIGTTAPSANLDVVGTVEMFGAWTSRSANTVYQAATDGFIVAWAASAYFKVITDGSSTPTTVRMEAEGATSNAARPNTMCPVRKGDYWKVEGTSGGTPTVWWMPIGQ
ncbi:MAG: hypothetical protein POELPBGB_02454 [Bacteroidia bacterium]|nr:hypothetical protein [Bacteroidia bacterium]